MPNSYVILFNASEWGEGIVGNKIFPSEELAQSWKQYLESEIENEHELLDGVLYLDSPYRLDTLAAHWGFYLDEDGRVSFQVQPAT